MFLIAKIRKTFEFANKDDVIYLRFADFDVAAVAEEAVANDTDRTGDGQFDIGFATAKGAFGNLFYTIRNLVAWLAEFYAGKEEFLTVFAIGDIILVEDQIIVNVLIIGEGSVVEGGPLLVFYLRGRFENLTMVNHTIRYIELSEAGTILKSIGCHKQSAFLDPVLGHIGKQDDGVA